MLSSVRNKEKSLSRKLEKKIENSAFYALPAAGIHTKIAVIILFVSWNSFINQSQSNIIM